MSVFLAGSMTLITIQPNNYATDPTAVLGRMASFGHTDNVGKVTGNIKNILYLRWPMQV